MRTRIYTDLLALGELEFRSMHKSSAKREPVRGRFDTSEREYDMYDKREIRITRVHNINVDILISILVILSMQGLIRRSAT